MKTRYILSHLIAVTLLIFSAGCSKESDQVAPTTSVSVVPGRQFAVGDTWPQGPQATGLTCDVKMTLVKETTPADGQIAKWEGMADCPPATKLIYKGQYTNYLGQTFLYTTTTQPTGECTMLTFYLASKQ